MRFSLSVALWLTLSGSICLSAVRALAPERQKIGYKVPVFWQSCHLRRRQFRSHLQSVRLAGLAATQGSIDPHYQLARVERFDDIVVGAELKSTHDVVLALFSGDHDHG